MSHLQQAKRVFDIEISSLKILKSRLNKTFDQAVDLILDTVARKNKLVILGVGKSGHIGEKIAATFTSTGVPSTVLSALNAMHGDLGLVAEGDLVIALSYSGETEELLRILPSLKRQSSRIISFTARNNSTLADYSDVVLNVSVQREACPLNLAPTSSTTSMLVLGDALAMAVLSARGFKKEDFALYHPGGNLGRLLLKVSDVMRPLDHVAVLDSKEKVSVSLKRMTEKRCGATILVNKQGKLAGIYTHGDFVRSFQKNKDIGSMPLDKVMTPKPISVTVDKPAVEVLNIFEKHKVEDLIVLDKQRRPVGLIDIQDLTKLKLL